MDEILRQALYALMARPDSTLIDVEKLLSRTDDTFRQEVIRTSEDEQTRYFFESTYQGSGQTRVILHAKL
jgi:hypothetical protein